MHNQPVLSLLRKYGIHIFAAAQARTAVSDFAVLSKRVAMRQNCLSLLNTRLMRLHSL